MPDAAAIRRRGQRHAGQHRAHSRPQAAEPRASRPRQYHAAHRNRSRRLPRRAPTASAPSPPPARTRPPDTGRWSASTSPSRSRSIPHGFPPDVMNEFERRTGRRSLGNKAASGTEIIKELGEEHMRTGSPIVYTSADSVFQIAAHEEVIPLWELYKICETARDILRGPHEVGRVIARPFTGAPGNFARTANRHDYAVPPPKDMLLDQLHDRKSTSTASARSSTSSWGAASRIPPRRRTIPRAWRRRWKPCRNPTAA